MLLDTVERDSIQIMVNKFYIRVLQDDLLRPYFVRALGEDMNAGKWPTHLSTLNDFWLKMMTGKGAYGGHPFPPHAFLGEMYYETFQRWLKLFKETLSTFYTPEITEKFYKKSEVLAAQFMENLDIEKE